MRPRGAIVLQVLRHNGEPAVGANVRVAGGKSKSTDKRGRVQFDDLKAMRLTVRVRQIGLLDIVECVDVVAHQTTWFKLQEPKGLHRDLVVVDEQGEPLPYAQFEISRIEHVTPWIDEHAGVQRLDRFTDHLGRRTITRVDRRMKQIVVTWGSRKTTVDIGNDETGELRVVLERKDP